MKTTEKPFQKMQDYALANPCRTARDTRLSDYRRTFGEAEERADARTPD